MKMYFICENCGCDELKSMRSPLDFKYGSKVQIPVFSCKQCGDLYAAVPTKKSVMIGHVICYIMSLIVSLVFWIRFFNEYPPSDQYADDIYHSPLYLVITSSFLSSVLLYDLIVVIWNYWKCFFGTKPLSYVLVHADKYGNAVRHPKGEQPDFTVRLDNMTKYIKKIKEHTAYKCTIDSEYGVVRVMDYEITENELILKVKKIRTSKFGKGSRFILIMPDGNTVMGRGRINSVCSDDR